MKDYSFFIGGGSDTLQGTDCRQRSLFFISQLLLWLAILLAPSLWAAVSALALWLLLNGQFRPHRLKTGLALGLIFFVVLESALLLFMIRSELFPSVPAGTETMIIPGAAVIGDRPGELLKTRLLRALPVLKQHPGMRVIVSGGRSPEDDVSEARAMKNYLTGAGIAEERIVEEPTARDTIGNFENAAVLIRENGLSSDVLIVTNEFHGFRSAALARTLGLTPKTAPALSPRRTLVRSMLREAASLVKVILTYGTALR